MALEKDGSKLIENCIKMMGRNQGKNSSMTFKLHQILDEIINLPMYSEQQFIAYQQQPILFSDLLTNKFSNYVVQTSFENSDQFRRQIIINKINQAMETIPNLKETPFKHILKYLKKHDLVVKGN